MYGLIFENFSGYIKVSGLSYSQQRPFIIYFKIICVARKMPVLANIEIPLSLLVFESFAFWQFLHICGRKGGLGEFDCHCHDPNIIIIIIM